MTKAKHIQIIFIISLILKFVIFYNIELINNIILFSKIICITKCLNIFQILLNCYTYENNIVLFQF